MRHMVRKGGVGFEQDLGLRSKESQQQGSAAWELLPLLQDAPHIGRKWTQGEIKAQ
jgi:hypothetical protein